MSEKDGNMLGVWVKDHLMISLIEIEFAKDFSPTEVVYHYSVPSSIAVANQIMVKSLCGFQQRLCEVHDWTIWDLSAALAKSGPLDFPLEKSFLLFFAHEKGLGQMFKKE